MKCIIEQTIENGWVAVDDNADESDLVTRIKTANMIISDLDGTDTSAGKQFIYNFLLNHNHLLDPRFWKLMLSSGIKAAKKGKISETEIWKDFVETFLREKKELEKVESQFTPQFADKTLYQGVREFYNIFRQDTKKIYVTRNIKEMAQPYATTLTFNDYFCEQFDKRKSIEQIIKKYGHKKKIIIKGDTQEDEQMAQQLRNEKQKGTIEKIIYINVCRNQKVYNPNADINTSRNHQALNNWLRNTDFKC